MKFNIELGGHYVVAGPESSYQFHIANELARRAQIRHPDAVVYVRHLRGGELDPAKAAQILTNEPEAIVITSLARSHHIADDLSGAAGLEIKAHAGPIVEVRPPSGKTLYFKPLAGTFSTWVNSGPPRDPNSPTHILSHGLATHV